MSTRANLSRQHGFSLIEAMVGITVGLIAVLIISQTFISFETQKQTTTAGGDAQENGLMALSMIEEHVRSAGAGLADPELHKCANYFSYYDPDPGSGPGGAPLPDLSTAPLRIVDGGAAGSDTVITGSSAFIGSVPAIMEGDFLKPYTRFDTDRTANVSFSNNDRVLLVQPDKKNCMLMQVTVCEAEPDNDSATCAAVKELVYKPGAPYNPDAAYQTLHGWPDFHAMEGKTQIYKMGQAAGVGMTTTSYSVAGGQLRAQSGQLGAATTTEDLVRNVVSLQARYGIANPDSENVNGWVDATGEWVFGTLDATHIRRIKALEVLVVTRSERREPAEVTSDAWFAAQIGDAGMRDAVANSIKAAFPDGEWAHYRYKIYTNVIALRNVLWPDIK